MSNLITMILLVWRHIAERVTLIRRGIWLPTFKQRMEIRQALPYQSFFVAAVTFSGVLLVCRHHKMSVVRKYYGEEVADCGDALVMNTEIQEGPYDYNEDVIEVAFKVSTAIHGERAPGTKEFSCPVGVHLRRAARGLTEEEIEALEAEEAAAAEGDARPEGRTNMTDDRDVPSLPLTKEEAAT